MSLFPDTIAAALAGAKVQCAPLVQFEFTSETMRLWRGRDVLETNDGNKWLPLRLGSLSGLEQAVNGQAPVFTFTLSGVDADVQRHVKDEWKAEVLGRPARIFVQFFGVDDPDDPDNQRPLDNPFPLLLGRCLQPRFPLDAGGNRSVEVDAETLFSLRSRPQYAMYTDADQQRRFPGDKGFEFVGSLVNKTVTWPDY